MNTPGSSSATISQSRVRPALARSQLERQQTLRKLYSGEGDGVAEARPHWRGAGRQQATKENVPGNRGGGGDRGDGGGAPAPRKEVTRDELDEGPMTDKATGASRPHNNDNSKSNNNNNNNNGAVTPSPKQEEDSSPPPADAGVNSEEDAAAREARRRAWPLQDIEEPGPHDCLFGRGGGTNHHPGNKRYRQVVEDHKGTYLASKRLDKPLVAMRIIAEWRALDPPGRFLKQDERTKFWNDVGDRKAREKTSQALREKTPVKARPGGHDGAAPRLPHGSLARDHSLGETGTGTEMSLEGFSWDDTDRPVVRNDRADVTPVAAGGGGGRPRPRYREEPPRYGGRGDPRDPYAREDHRAARHYYPGGHRSPAEAGGYHQWEHSRSSYYGHHYAGRGPPPPPRPPEHHRGPHPPPPPSGHGHPPPPYHHPPPPPPPPSHYASPHNHHHQASYPHHHTPASQQRSREHSLQMNPLNGASTSQPAPDPFANERSPRHHYPGPPPPPLPSPTYDNQPPPYYDYSPSPRQGGWPTPPGGGGAPSPAPKPQFTYRSGSNPSAFGRYDSRANSIQSLGSSVDAYYDRRDSGASNGGSVAAKTAASPAHSGAHLVVAVAGTSQDFSKIAELIRDSSERTRSNSLDECSRVEREGYEDAIPRSKSMPHPESGNKAGSSREEGADKMPSEHLAGREKSSLIRKLSGGSIPAGQSSPVERRPGSGSNGRLCHPKPIKRDTSNKPETLETKRSIKRAVLSRDQSAVSRRLKQEQEEGRLADQKLKRAELIDRKLSVELNKMGLEDIKDDDRPSLDRLTTKNILGRMTTEEVFGRQPLDRMTTEDVLGAFIDDEHSPSLDSPSPLHTIDALEFAKRCSNENSIGNVQSADGADDWDKTLDLVNDPSIPAAPVVHDGEMSGGVNADVAEKWLKGET